MEVRPANIYVAWGAIMFHPNKRYYGSFVLIAVSLFDQQCFGMVTLWKSFPTDLCAYI